MCELHLGSTRDSGDPAGKPQCDGRTAPPWRWNGTRITLGTRVVALEAIA
jgi:hypothetical protein